MRIPISEKDAAKVLYESDRTCCICRQANKRVQIHHIDGNHSNSDIDNLAVLCLDCHMETQITGGFTRQLNAEVVSLYKSSWIELVAMGRKPPQNPTKEDKTRRLANQNRLNLLKEKARDQNDLTSLITLSEISGNNEERDKYIDLFLATEESVQAHIYYRAKQGKLYLVNQTKISSLLSSMRRQRNWSQLARAYKHLGQNTNAIEFYCKSIIEDISENNFFSAAYYLKELSQSELYPQIFELALQESRKNNDIWWQVRALQELNREEDIAELIREHRDEIEKSENRANFKLLLERFAE